MTDVIVTIRLPPPLLAELKRLAREQYYVDASELVRGILRRKYEKSVSAGSELLSESIIGDIKKHTLKTSEARLAEELLNIRKRLREELK